MLISSRDTEESAPAEFPPEQPEADVGADDGTAYGAEEVELEEGLKAELAKVEGEDEEMDGAEDTAGPSATADTKDEDEESNAGSEDLEAESSGSEDEEEEIEEGEGEADEDMEMGDGDENTTHANGHKEQPVHQKAQGEVMVH
jgi:histone chaperone ASF1